VKSVVAYLYPSATTTTRRPNTHRYLHSEPLPRNGAEKVVVVESMGKGDQ